MDQGLKYYRRLLGVGPGARAEELRAAFRRRVREVHPDLNPGQSQAAIKLQQLQLAYAALTVLAKAAESPPPPPPALPLEPPSLPETAWRLTGVEAAGLDVVYHLAVAGPGRAVLPHRRDQLCPRCQGRGRSFQWRWARLSFEERTCPRCRGAGLLERVEPLEVTIPAEPGRPARLTFPGHGRLEAATGRRGDLILLVASS